MATPTIDGTVSAIFSTLASKVFNLTTTKTNDLIVVAIAYELGAAQRNVASVTATGLTFTLRKKVQSGASNFPSLEIWTAPAAAIQTAVAITVTMDAAIDDACICAFGVNGLFSTASPYDPNVSLPGSASSSGTAAPSITVSTTYAHDLILWFCMQVQNATTLATGFTSIITATNNGGGAACGLVAGLLSRSTVATNLVCTAGAGGSSNKVGIVDAVTGDNAPPPVAGGASQMLMGVG